METNKMDKNIREKLQERTFMPSNSAWERLSVQLDEQPAQKRKGWFFYISIAASILLLVSLGIQLLSNDQEEIQPNHKVVKSPIDKIEINRNIDKLVNEIPVEEAIVKTDKIEEKITVKKSDVIAKKIAIPKKNKITASFKEEQVVAKVKKENIKSAIPAEIEESKITILKRDPNSRIKINSDDLLYAVTHSSTEVKEYYAKHNLTRDDVLKTIKSELQKSNIKINPNTILAEVERNIGEEDFQNNFMKTLKNKISNIATVIASRND